LVVTRGFPRTSALGQTLGYSILATVFAAIILALALEARDSPGLAARVLGAPPLRALGLYSYGMYVFHKPLHDLVGKTALESLGLDGPISLGPGLAYVVVAGGVTLGAGMLSYHLYERHFLALKGRFQARRPETPG
jgi:peptidoglycan/LPS O-acetylase OafA/YrhL